MQKQPAEADGHHRIGPEIVIDLEGPEGDLAELVECRRAGRADAARPRQRHATQVGNEDLEEQANGQQLQAGNKLRLERGCLL